MGERRIKSRFSDGLGGERPDRAVCLVGGNPT